jgi:hypothetical protein
LAKRRAVAFSAGVDARFLPTRYKASSLWWMKPTDCRSDADRDFDPSSIRPSLQKIPRHSRQGVLLSDVRLRLQQKKS